MASITKDMQHYLSTTLGAVGFWPPKNRNEGFEPFDIVAIRRDPTSGTNLVRTTVNLKEHLTEHEKRQLSRLVIQENERKEIIMASQSSSHLNVQVIADQLLPVSGEAGGGAGIVREVVVDQEHRTTMVEDFRRIIDNKVHKNIAKLFVNSSLVQEIRKKFILGLVIGQVRGGLKAKFENSSAVSVGIENGNVQGNTTRKDKCSSNGILGVQLLCYAFRSVIETSAPDKDSSQKAKSKKCKFRISDGILAVDGQDDGFRNSVAYVFPRKGAEYIKLKRLKKGLFVGQHIVDDQDEQLTQEEKTLFQQRVKKRAKLAPALMGINFLSVNSDTHTGKEPDHNEIPEAFGGFSATDLYCRSSDKGDFLMVANDCLDELEDAVFNGDCHWKDISVDDSTVLEAFEKE